MSDSLKNERLSEAEHTRLREFLARGGDAAMPVDAIDGLFAALVCSPIATGPSQWMELIWGGDGPKLTDLKEAEEFFGLILRMWNQVASDINDGTYEVLTVVEELEDGTEIPYPHDWCQGFFEGTDLHKEFWWDISRDPVMLLIQPIADIVADEALRSGQKANLEGFRVIPESEYDDMCDEIAENVCLLREYWLEHPVPQPSQKPTTRSEPRVGRNDPCPCGSGKKFKQCHGAGGSIH